MTDIFTNIGKFLSGTNPIAALVDDTIGKAVDKALDFIPDPAQKAAAQQAMETLKASEEAKQLDADVAQIASVNATMQAELANSKDESWYQKGWRPANGFCVALGSLFGVVSVCGLLFVGIVYNNAQAIAAIPAIGFAISGILAVPGAAVGIAAWHRGMLQRETATASDSSDASK